MTATLTSAINTRAEPNRSFIKQSRC
jgi:hypothetical protein